MSESDASSVVSAGGGASVAGTTRGVHDPSGPADQSELLEHNQNISAAIFGVVYTLSKEKYDRSNKFAVAKICLDFLQLLILIVSPAFGWKIDENLWLWKAISYLQFKNPLIAKGYTFYIAVLYITIACLVLGLGLCVWVGWCFKNDRFPYIWPIKVLRLVVSIFFVVFYIASLSVFLMALQCNYFNKDKAKRFRLEHFETECFALPHIIHAGLAVIATLCFIFVAVVMTIADFELNPLSSALLASPASVVELRAIVMKTAMCISSALLDGRMKVQSVVIVGAAWLLFWSYLRWMPHYNKWINHVRTSLYGGLSWAALMLLLLVFSKKRTEVAFAKQMTDALFGGLVPALLLSFGLSYFRHELFYNAGIKAFMEPDPKKKLKDIYKFQEVQQVEVLARCCRKWVDEDTLDPEAVKLADHIIKAGMATFGNNAGMVLMFSNFLIEVQNLYQSGHTQLQAAKKMSPTISQRFVIFIREQEHRQKAQTRSSGESATDLVSYVEFQRNYRTLIRCHKAALFATRDFWKQLLHHDVSFLQLTKAFSSIEGNEVRAEKSYRMILERYPTSAKLLRTYARFLEDVKHDPWGAAKYYSEAEKVEEEADNAQNDAVLDLGGDAEGGALNQVDERNNALMLINASGIIQMANKMATGLFGYKKGELEGKNVSMLMPNPFSQRHNSYLRNYVTTGKAKILNSVRSVVGMHKERHVFPLKLAVTKVSGSGSEATFMGVFLPEEDNASVVNCWVMTTGTVLCVDARFTDWFGKAHLDIVGKPVMTLAVEQDRISELLEAAANATEEELNSGMVTCKAVKILHKYLDSITCNIRVALGGTDGQRLLVMEITRTDKTAAASNLMVTDQKGQITFVTAGCAHMLGYTTGEMLKLGIANLMNPPFSLMHAKWLTDMPSKIPHSSCRNGATVVATTSNGASLPIRLTINTREDGEETLHLITMTKSSFEDGLDLRRLAARLDQDGHVLEVNASPAVLFSFKPSLLVGMEVDSFVDTLRQLVQQDDVKLPTLMHAMIAKVAEKPGISWRVGVRPPTMLDKATSDISIDPDHNTTDMKATAASSMLAGAQVKAGMMQLEVAEECDEQQLHVHVHRADAVTGIVEVDREGRIVKAGCCALHQPGLIFGCSSASMLRLPLGAFIDLGGLTISEALLGEGQGKGAMKTGTTTGIKLGPVKKLAGRHTDGDPLALMVQAVPRDAARRRIVVKINTVNASKGSTAALRYSLFGEDAAAAAAATVAGEAAGAQQPVIVKDGSRDAAALAEAEAAGNSATAQGMQGAEGKGLIPVDSIFGANMMQTQDISRLKAWVLDGAVGEGAPAHQAQRASISSIPGQRASATSLPLVAPTFETAYGAPFGGDDGASLVSADQSHITGSDSQGGENEAQTTDYRKGKRFKKLKRLLSGKNTQAAVERFHAHTYGVIMLMLLAHLACFIIFTTFIKSLHQYVYEVDAAGRANDMLHRIALNALMFREGHLGKDAPGIFTAADFPTRSMLMHTRIQEFDYNHRGIYLGFNKLRRFKDPLKALWETPNLTASYLVDVQHQIVENDTMTLWQLGNHFVMSAREVMSNHNRMAGSSTYFGPNTTDLEKNRHWHFVVKNAPAVLFESYKRVLEELLVRAMDQVQQVNHVNIALLVVEGCGVGAICFCYMWVLVKQVINMRYQLFSTFLIVPAGFLRVLASKQVHVDEDDDESDSEDEDVGFEANTQANKESAAVVTGDKSKASFLQLESKLKPTALEAAPEARTGLLGAIKTYSSAVVGFLRGSQDTAESGKRQLRRDARDIFLVLAPFVMWSVLVLIIYSVSYVSLKQNVVSGLIDNSIACTVDFRVTRVIYYSLDFCTQDTDAGKEEARQMVALSSGRLESAYSALMYGTSQGYVDSRFSSPGTTFTKGAPISYFFRAKGKCWRHDPSTCFNTSSEYYEITHNGIDAMMGRLVEDARLLSEDDNKDVNVSNTRLAYIWKVGNYDLHEGMQQASSQYSTRVLASFQKVLDLHIVLFVLSWTATFAFIVIIFKPFLRRVQAESRRVAELLSQLPADMDVEALVEQALGRRKGPEVHKHGRASLDASRPPGRASFDAKAAGRASLDAGELDVDGGDDMGKRRRATFNIAASGKAPAGTRGQRNDDASDGASSMNEY